MLLVHLTMLPSGSTSTGFMARGERKELLAFAQSEKEELDSTPHRTDVMFVLLNERATAELEELSESLIWYLLRTGQAEEIDFVMANE